MNLYVEKYISQIKYKDIEEVKKTIVDDVNKEIEHKEKQLQEIERKAELEKEKVKKEVVETEVFEPAIDDLPFGNIEEKTTYYTVYVTDKQRDLLIKFL